MQYPARYADLPEYAFPRLRRLLSGRAPGGPEIAMSLGEPQHPVPEFVGPIMLERSAALSKYPPNDGLPELREAISNWLARRYRVGEDHRDPETGICALNGTREGLFNACLALCPEEKNARRPAVLLPNPFYQCYTAAAAGAGGRVLLGVARAGSMPAAMRCAVAGDSSAACGTSVWSGSPR